MLHKVTVERAGSQWFSQRARKALRRKVCCEHVALATFSALRARERPLQQGFTHCPHLTGTSRVVKANLERAMRSG